MPPTHTHGFPRSHRIARRAYLSQAGCRPRQVNVQPSRSPRPPYDWARDTVIFSENKLPFVASIVAQQGSQLQTVEAPDLRNFPSRCLIESRILVASFGWPIIH